jgi:hypothetical protein
MSFYHKLKIECLPLVKTEISKTLLNLDEHHKIHYIDYLLEEIEKQSYVKEANINYIQKYLDKYQVDLKAVLDFDLDSLPHDFRHKIIDIHYKDMKPFSKEKDIAFQVQYRFINYFCKVVADDLIAYCKIKKASVSNKQENVSTSSIQNIHLEEFVFNVRCTDGLTREMNYYTYVKYNLDKYITELKKEINSNVIALEDRKTPFYFGQVLEVLEESVKDIAPSIIKPYVRKFNLDVSKLPDSENKEFKNLLNLIGSRYDPLNGKNYQIYIDAEKIQEDFYKYTSFIKVNEFIHKIKTLQTKYMDKPEKKKVSHAGKYGEVLSNYATLTKEHHYFRYYEDILMLHVRVVTGQVEENILNLDTIKIPLYLNKTIKEIESSGFQNISPTILSKYIEKYNIDLELLPEVENEELRKILNTKDYYQELPYNEFSEIEFIQEQFYKYGLRTETIKLLDYLRSLQVEYQITKNIEIQKPLNFNKTIFKSFEAQEWFENTLDELNALDENDKARSGFQAKANAIFSDSTCKKIIFKYGVLLKDFIIFLNKEYKAGIKAKDKLSDGLNHSNLVEELIQIHQES